MSRYADEDMYEVPEPVFGHKRRYGGGEAPAAKKSKTATALSSKKGSSRASGTHSSQFRFASVYNALKEIAKGLGGFKTIKDKNPSKTSAKTSAKSGISWSKQAVMMIASALDYKLRKLLVDATSFTSFTKKKTVSLAAVSHAAEVNGIPLNAIIGHNEERAIASALTGADKEQRKTDRTVIRGAKAKAAHTRSLNLSIRKEVAEARNADYKSSQQDKGFDKVTVAVSVASVKAMLKLAGAERSSSKGIHMILCDIAFGFLTNIVRNIIAVLALNNNLRVSENMTRTVLHSLGINSAGFAGAVRIVRKRRAEKANQEIREDAEEAISGGRGIAPEGMGV